MQSFIKVIGASAGVVALVFVLVVGVLYWADEEPAEAVASVRQAVAEKPPGKPDPVIAPPPPPRVERAQVEPPPLPDPATAVSAGRAVPKEGEEDDKMSAEEYIEREVYYIEKIQKDTKSVLQRAAQDRSKLAALESELDGLLDAD